jgi:dihydroorotate dehydrogenase subfamily 1
MSLKIIRLFQTSSVHGIFYPSFLGPILLFSPAIFPFMHSLSVDVGGLILRSPVMLAAGILGTTGASLRRAALAGAGGVVTKSVGSDPREGHPGPTVVQVECGLLNAMGLPNPGFREFQKEIDLAKTSGVPVVASIFGSSAAEFARIARGLKPDAFELNLSCPHAEKYGSELGRYPDLWRRSLERSRPVRTSRCGSSLPPIQQT